MMDRLELLITAANRASTVNKAFRSSMTPAEIAQSFAAEDVDLIIAWMEPTRADR